MKNNKKANNIGANNIAHPLFAPRLRAHFKPNLLEFAPFFTAKIPFATIDTVILTLLYFVRDKRWLIVCLYNHNKFRLFLLR